MEKHKVLVEFHIKVGRLKRLPRKGWVLRGIPDPETVAAHMCRSHLIAYDFAKALGQDPVTSSELMPIHDLPEAIADDITPHCGVSKEEKAALELRAAEELAILSGNPEYLTGFLEFEEKKTLRSQLCNDADQIECVLQALEYAQMYPQKRDVLEEFWPSAYGKLLTPIGFKTFDELFARKRELYKLDIPKSPGLTAG